MPHATSATSDLSGDYWLEARRPWVSLVFVTPLLLIYEAGVLCMGPRALRNGADLWLRDLLESLGFGQYFLLPLLTCAVLLAWHHTRQETWNVRGSTLAFMLVESAAFALLLFAWARFQGSLLTPASMGPAAVPSIVRLVGYCGAGIYEELLFRLMLLPALAAACRSLGVSKRASVVTSMVVTSLLFSAAHYQVFTNSGYPFDWPSFIFRFLAGMFFAVLFVARGFGVAAGAHAVYDILVELA